MKNKTYLRLVVLMLCVGLLGTAAWAQSTTAGAIGGTVVDPQNLVVPGATITATNTGTNQAQSATSDDAGSYRIVQLQPGTYVVSVTAKGFAPFKAENVTVNVGSLTPLNPHMTIGATEHVEVSAEAPVINVTSAEFAPTLTEKAIQNLPINGGRWSSFTVLTPGVVSNSDGFGLLSFRGTSAILNNVTVDGADNNQAFFSEERGRTRAGYSTAKVAVQEFQVNTSNYSSEYGRSAGGVVNTVTKSGTNQLHGEAFWYDRNNDWGAMNAYTSLTSVVPNGSGGYTASTKPYKPKDIRMMGGFGVGGAIIKDKLFWFLAYDKFHRNFPGTAVPTSAASFFALPDAALPEGKVCGGANAAKPSTIDGNVCTLAAMIANHKGSPTADNISAVTADQYATAAKMWSSALFGGNAFGYDQLGIYDTTGPVVRKGDQGIIFPKVDWIINQKNHAFFEVNRMRWASPGGVQTQATNNYGKSSFGNDYVKNTWGVAKLDTQISNRLSNQFRFQYGRDFEYETDQTPNAFETQTLTTPVNALTGVPTGYTNPLGLPPNVSIGSYQWGTLYYTNRIAYPDEYKTQLADTMNYTMGRHNLKFGVDFSRTSDSMNNLYMQYGQYKFSGLQQYIAQLYDPTHAYFNDFYQGMQGGAYNNVPTTFKFSNTDFAFFVQDDWKLARRLTVNLGLRYDTETMPSPYQDLQQEITLGDRTLTTGTMPDRPSGWGPRAGFAFDVFGDSKTVLRGGYGIYYGRVTNGHIYSALTATGNTSSPLAQVSYDYYAGASGATLQNGAFPQIYQTSAAFPTGTLTAATMEKNFKFPSVQEIDLSLQRELGWNTVLSVSYLGSLGHHLANFTDLNLAAPGSQYCGTVSARNTSTGVVSTANAGKLSTYSVANCPTSPVTVGTTATTYGVLTPPTGITYTVNNNSVEGMPYANGATLTAPFYTTRLNTAYGAVIDAFSGANSNYNALAIQFEKRMSNHVQFSVNYTWSHALDTGVNGTTNFSGTTYANVLDPRNPNWGMYGNSSNNVPQRLTLHAVIESPWQHHSAFKYLLDGWQAAPVFQTQTGLSYSVSTGGGSATQVVDGFTYKGISGGLLGAGGSYNFPGARGMFTQPSTYIFDLRLSKQFPIRERFKLEFSADSFNLFNHQNVTGVNTTGPYYITAGTASAGPALTPNSSAISSATGALLLGTPTNANSNFVYNPRQIQLGLRLMF